MSDDKIVELNPIQRREARTTDAIVEVIEEMLERARNGDMREFVAVSLDGEGEAVIHASCNDIAGGVGLYEIGKHILISQYQD